MIRKFTQKVTTYNKVAKVVDNHAALYAGFLPLTQLVSEFKTQLATLDGQMQISQNAKGKLTDEKEMRFEKLVSCALKLSRKALAWAKKNQQADAVHVYDLTKTDFTAPTPAKITLAKNLLNQLEKDLKQLADYRINQADLDALSAAILDANNYSTDPKLKKIKGAEANRFGKQLLKEIDETLDQMQNLIQGEFEDINATFVNLFLHARHIDDIGTRKTKLLVHVTDKEGKPLQDVFVDVLEMEDEEQYTDAEGNAIISGIKSGSYYLKISKDTLSKTAPFTLKMGEQLRQSIILA